MKKTHWTAEQSAAIELRGSLLIAAAAGSGKTAVLVERLIHRITDDKEPEDIDRFLVVTFTKAAANEMRERIGKALDDAIFHEQETREIERLLRQRTLLHGASIMTLHSFCLELIRKYFYRLELDPTFRVTDQAEADLLRLDVIEDLFETKYEQNDPAFLKLVDAFGSDRDDQPLMEQVLRLYEFAYSQPHPAVWLSELNKAYVWDNIESFMQSAWGKAIRQALQDIVSESSNLLKRAEQIAKSPGGPILYTATLQDDLKRVRLLNHVLNEGHWAEIEAQIQSVINYSRLPAIRSKSKESSVNNADAALQKSLQEECKNLRNEAKKKLNSFYNKVFAYSPKDQLSALREMGIMAQTLGNLVSEFSQLYSTAKMYRNVLDFIDLEHYALRLLEEKGEASSIAQELKKYFVEILVDEYQDINPVQEHILQLISRQNESPNLFMVGDIKQSIYRFRMADPSLFLNKYNSLPHWHTGIPGSKTPSEMVIDLNRNFRSRIEVVEGVNFLFRQIMTKGTGEIPYDDFAALLYGASFVSGQDQVRTAEGPIETHLIDLKNIKNQLVISSESAPMEGDSGSENKLTTEIEETIFPEDLEEARLEARLVGERIQRIVQGAEFQIYDQKLKDFRPVQYSDIVILMRSYSAVASIYVEEFQNANIPVYAETTTGYFRASEVETILSLLKIIDNPHLDIPLAAVLRSPLVGLNGSELGKIRMMLPEGDFYESLTIAVWAGLNDGSISQERIKDFKQILGHYEESLERKLQKAHLILAAAPTLKDKITDFWFNLQTWRTLSRHKSLADLLWSLYEETGYLTYVGTLPSGAQRQANLRVLYDRARLFEETRYRGLFRFLRFLDRFQEQGKDMGNARALGETEDVVRLMTVHASKGLEFPVIFVVDLGRTFNTQSLKGKVLLHSKLGIGMPIIDTENYVRYHSLIHYAVKQVLTQELLAEELRILYVALTRAKERLFLYGTIDNLDKTLLKWQRTSEWQEVALPEELLRSAKCFLDWIGPALARHPENFFGEGAGQSALPIPEINSRWEIHIHQNIGKSITTSSENKLDIEQSQQPQKKKTVAVQDESRDLNKAKTAEHWFTEVNRRLSWHYPYTDSVRQVAKTSVSELKRQYNWQVTEEAEVLSTNWEYTDSLKRPKFLQAAKQLTAAERGTALHTVMQHIPIKKWSTCWITLQPKEQLNYIMEFLNRLEQCEILSTEQKDSIQPEQIVQFLSTPLGQRFFSSEEILREIPFTITFPADNQANILVQGVIDVVLISKDDHQEIHAEIVDYKTDSFRTIGTDGIVNNDTIPEQILLERYILQLTLYALAIERLLKIRVSRCTLYSFTLGREIALSDEQRKKMLVQGFPFFQNVTNDPTSKSNI